MCVDGVGVRVRGTDLGLALGLAMGLGLDLDSGLGLDLGLSCNEIGVRSFVRSSIHSKLLQGGSNIDCSQQHKRKVQQSVVGIRLHTFTLMRGKVSNRGTLTSPRLASPSVIRLAFCRRHRCGIARVSVSADECR